MVLAVAGCSSGGSSGSGADPGAKASTTAASSTTTTSAVPKPLADQAAPTSINGIAVQGDTIWVASIKDDLILQVDRESGAILRRIDTKGAGPDDVAVAPDGSIWSTGFGNGDVGHITGGKYSVVTNLGAGINPIAVDAEGVVWIGSYGPNGSLYEVDPKALPASGAPAPVAKGTMPDINAFGILDDGTIVSPAGGIAGPGSAIAIDPDTGTFTTIVGDLPGVAAGTTDSQGRPYVLANAVGQVIAVNLDDKTSQVTQTVKKGAPFDNLSFADDGTLYLSSFIAPTITEVQPDGTERLITIGG